ncbi:hypothetical protein [Thermaurantiacus sp.]
MRARLLLLLVAAAAQAMPAAADPRLDGAAALWAAGKHGAARPLLRALANEGNPAAETLLGVMAARGLGGPREPAVAVAWFVRAARRDYRPAQRALAEALRRGEGVRADPEAARRLELEARRS